ncbi:hypothetical protein [Actinomadura nitritigenes]|uniref:hypothetical protein n=1 Tax=Actinomadura nitritigenes TaxID=134602 RepID=UPI003D89EFCD
MVEPGGEYEIRFGPTLKGLGALVVGLIGCASCALPSGMTGIPIWFRVIFGILIGAATAGTLITMFSRRVALRIDANGITLTTGPLFPKSGLLFAAWPEVEAIVLWKQPSANNMPYIGIRRRHDIQKSKPAAHWKRIIALAGAPHIPSDLAAHSHQINGWRLDRARLTEAVGHFAPEVEIIEID